MPRFAARDRPRLVFRLLADRPPWKPGLVTARLVRSARLYPGVPYAYASVASPAALVFTAGACPLDPAGQVADAGDVRAQARQAVSNLAEALAAAGSGMTHVLKTTIYVASADRADLVAAWEVISSAFGEHDVPSTLLGVTVLGWPGQLVEIEAVATAASQAADADGSCFEAAEQEGFGNALAGGDGRG